MIAKSEMRDEELVGRCAEGDNEAASELVSRYMQKLLQLAQLLAPEQRGNYEDIVQDVFLKAFKNIHLFQGNASFKTWLYAIARVTSQDWRRNFFRRSLHLLSPLTEHENEFISLPDAEPAILNRLATEESTRLLRQALERLPHKLKTALILREWDGLSYDEIAEILAVPSGTVRSRIHNARALLAAALKEDL